MALSRPNAVVTVRGQPYTVAEGAVLRVRLQLSARGAHDRAELHLWPGSALADVEVGSELTVALGERDAEEDVFGGEVTSVAAGPEALVVEAYASTTALSRSRLCQTWLGKSVADIVRDLAGDAPIDEVEGATKLDAYSVDDRRTAWAHLRDLAALTGSDLGAGASGGLRFVPPKSGPAAVTLRAAAELLSWRLGPAQVASPPGVVAHGAASEAGSEKWHWIRRDPAASGAASPVRIAPSAHNGDAASATGQALEARAARRGVRGELRVVGQPGLRPGDRVDLDGVPSAEALRLLDVEHVLDARAGFWSHLVAEGAGAAGGPAP